MRGEDETKTLIAGAGFAIAAIAAGAAQGQTESPVSLDTGSGVLQGTLMMPAHATPTARWLIGPILWRQSVRL